MKTTIWRQLALGLLLGLSSGMSLAETDNTASPAPPADTVIASPVNQGAAPTAVAPRLILAMDRILPGSTEDRIKALVPEESRAVLNLYLAGQIRQWYFRQDRPGAIFLLEADSLEAAQALVDSLPLSQAGLLAYDLIPVGPYIPLSTLLRPTAPEKPARTPAKAPRKKAN